jgi:squalene-associated FAD-dependent desaturase
MKPLRIPSHAHVVGAGLAGLAAALSLARAGSRVTVYESGPAAGGRCRSYFDRGLGRRIDNGNHLLLSGNRAAMEYLDEIGARDTLGGPGVAAFPFHDLSSDEFWTVRPSPGRIPWWVLRRSSRVPGTRLAEYLALRALLRAGEAATVAAALEGAGTLYRRLLEPLAISALNTRPDTALASLLLAVVRETLLSGGEACVPAFPRQGLSESFVDPALRKLRAAGHDVLLGRRVAALERQAGRISRLRLTDEAVEIGASDAVVLAVPAAVAADLLPDVTVPDAFEAILNVHFAIEADMPASWGGAGFCGLIGGTAEWVFAKPGIVSVTVSAANHLVDRTAEEIAALIWGDVRRCWMLPETMPPVRVVKEKRATIAATAAQERRRPPSAIGRHIGVANLALAGDWTATGLPATIEGAIRSGRAAAAALLDA